MRCPRDGSSYISLADWSRDAIKEPVVTSEAIQPAMLNGDIGDCWHRRE